MRFYGGPRTHDGHAFMWQTQPASIIEVDWLSAEAGTIAVNRNEMELSEKGHQAISWLSEQIVDMCRNFLLSAHDSAYSLLNSRLTQREFAQGIKTNWIVQKTDRKTVRTTWEELRVPLISVVSLNYSYRPETEAKWNSLATSIVHCLGDEDDENPYTGLAWHGPNVPPDRICAKRGAGLLSSYSLGVSPVWTEDLTAARPSHPAGLACRFPPKWNHLSSVQFENYEKLFHKATIWNPENILVRAVTADALAWCSGNFKDSLDPLPVKGSLLTEKARVASWMVMCLAAEQHEIWDGLGDREPSFLPTVWNIVFGTQVNPKAEPQQGLLQWVED
jgi:hypothetical protein